MTTIVLQKSDSFLPLNMPRCLQVLILAYSASLKRDTPLEERDESLTLESILNGRMLLPLKDGDLQQFCRHLFVDNTLSLFAMAMYVQTTFDYIVKVLCKSALWFVRTHGKGMVRFEQKNFNPDIPVQDFVMLVEETQSSQKSLTSLKGYYNLSVEEFVARVAERLISVGSFYPWECYLLACSAQNEWLALYFSKTLTPEQCLAPALRAKLKRLSDDIKLRLTDGHLFEIDTNEEPDHESNPDLFGFRLRFETTWTRKKFYKRLQRIGGVDHGSIRSFVKEV